MSTHDPRTLMVLGAGRGQVGLLRAARERGLRTVVVTLPGRSLPGLAMADEVEHADLLDPAAVAEVAVRVRPDGIATSCMDTAVPALAEACAATGLPGLSPAAARLCSDKAAMKAAFAAFDLVVHAVIEPALPLLVARAPALVWVAAGVQVLWHRRGSGRAAVPAGSGMSARKGVPARRDTWAAAFIGGWRAGSMCLRGGWLLMLAVTSGSHAGLLTMVAATLLMNAHAYGPMPRWAHVVAGGAVALAGAVGAWPA